MITKKIKKNKGFVILFAVTLSAILLSIALGVANIALKEINFSTSARNTNDAFTAADTGAECALFYDKLSASSFPIDGPATAISCASAMPSFSATANTGSYNFKIIGLGSLGTSCAKVNVLKDRSVSPMSVVITSTGYNIGDADCNSTNPNRVERELKISSTASVPLPPAGLTFTETPSTIQAGNAVTVSWTNLNTQPPNPVSTNWIGLYPPAVNDYGYLAYIYAGTCTTSVGGVPGNSGSCSFTIPSSTPAGTYTIALFADIPPSNGITRTSSFTVTAAP